MPLYRPSELHNFLREKKAYPNKKLSQNFLIDGNIIQKIVQASQACADDNFLEIGPGPGALTEALLKKGVKLTAIEKDSLFAESLSRFSGITIHHTDILEFSLDQLKSEKKGKVAANLPYHLTSPILNLLLPRYDLFEQVTVMVQEEVARRIVAKPQSKDYSSLTVFVNLYSEAHYAFSVSRNCFYPKPKVDSGVVTFFLKRPEMDNPQPFLDFMRLLFCHRRKMIRTILSHLFPKEQIDEGLVLQGVSVQSRPEELTCQRLIGLFNFLSK